MTMSFDDASDDEDFTIPLHPIQRAMAACIREQIEADANSWNKFILRDLSVAQLYDVIRFVESFDPDNLPE